MTDPCVRLWNPEARVDMDVQGANVRFDVAGADLGVVRFAVPLERLTRALRALQWEADHPTSAEDRAAMRSGRRLEAEAHASL